jgi:serine/threonine protein kinase
MSDQDTSSPKSTLSEISDSWDSPIISKRTMKPNYNDLVLVKVLNKAKFSVLLGYLPTTRQSYAVKLFPHVLNKPSRFFSHEIRFMNLSHENVTSIVHYEQEREATFEDGNSKISYTVMELAPYGDFCDLILSQRLQLDDKLARTYFHQLIEGMEYLHSVGIAHLDLKCDNLLLSENYKLKICDFDQAYIKGQENIFSNGTPGFRAPELVQRRCRNLEAADIYSAGIILFTFKCQGFLPYEEKEKVQQGMDMFNMMMCCPDQFWQKHSKVQHQKLSFFDEDFRSLFLSMVAYKPSERASIQQIKKSKWYNGPIYSQNELEDVLKNKL